MLVFFRVLQLLLLYGGGAFLCYVPFHGALRLAPYKLVAALVLLFSVIIASYTASLLLVSANAAQCVFFMAVPLNGFFYLRSIRESSYKTVLVLLLVVCYLAFLCGCAIFFANLIFPAKGISYEILYTVALFFIGGSTYRLLYRFMLEHIVPIVTLVSDSDLQFIYFMPLFYIILQIVFFVFYDSLGLMNDLIYFVVLVAVNVSAYFVVMDIFNILNSTVDKRRMQEEISITEKLLELQKSQYASWVTQIEAVRRARHDLKHHIALVQFFLDNNDRVGLQEHLHNFQRTLPESAPMQLCKNMEVNAILLHYYERARRENVKLELLVNVDEKVTINALDLAVVFGNCLENAFEACSRMAPTEERTVSLMAKPMGRGLAIVLDNTFDGQTVKQNDVYLSSKRVKQVGIGMASVKLVAQKYAGIVNFETDGNIFMTSIRLGGKIVTAGNPQPDEN